MPTASLPNSNFYFDQNEHPVFLISSFRDVAQPGSASALGAEGPRFESWYPDKKRVSYSKKTAKPRSERVCGFESHRGGNSRWWNW